jgi:hypothetical protein
LSLYFLEGIDHAISVDRRVQKNAAAEADRHLRKVKALQVIFYGKLRQIPASFGAKRVRR